MKIRQDQTRGAPTIKWSKINEAELTETLIELSSVKQRINKLWRHSFANSVEIKHK